MGDVDGLDADQLRLFAHALIQAKANHDAVQDYTEALVSADIETWEREAVS